MSKEDFIMLIKNIPSDLIIKFRIVFEDPECERHYIEIEFDNNY